MFESRADMIDGHARIPITDWLRENATQIAELQAAGCAKIYREKVSGAKADRKSCASLSAPSSAATCSWSRGLTDWHDRHAIC